VLEGSVTAAAPTSDTNPTDAPAAAVLQNVRLSIESCMAADYLALCNAQQPARLQKVVAN